MHQLIHLAAHLLDLVVCRAAPAVVVAECSVDGVHCLDGEQVSVVRKTSLHGAGISKAGISKAGISKAGISKAGISKAGICKAGISKAGICKAGIGKAGRQAGRERQRRG